MSRIGAPASFFLSTSVLLAIFATALFGYVLPAIGPDRGIRWVGEMYETKTQSAASLRSPKTVLVGGSSTLFGVSALRLNQLMPQADILNFGTHAGLGIDFILQKSKEALDPGDSVVLIIEYELLHENGTPSPVLAEYLAHYEKSYLRAQPFVRQIKLRLGVPIQGAFTALLRNLLGLPDRPGAYSIEGVTPLGDYEIGEAALSRASIPPALLDGDPPIQLAGPISDYSRNALNGYIKWASESGVHVVVAWPVSLWRDEYLSEPYGAYFSGLYSEVQSLDVPVVGTPLDAMLQSRDMLDTQYHANPSGRLLRTNELARLLSKALPDTPNVSN